jgi:segregation and condensation protein A
VSIDHLHATTVSVREQAGVLSERLRRTGTATFRSLTADCSATIEIVARFLALLELFREALVAFEQLAPLGDLLVRWTGGDEASLPETEWPDEGAATTAPKPEVEGETDAIDTP